MQHQFLKVTWTREALTSRRSSTRKETTGSLCAISWFAGTMCECSPACPQFLHTLLIVSRLRNAAPCIPAPASQRLRAPPTLRASRLHCGVPRRTAKVPVYRVTRFAPVTIFVANRPLLQLSRLHFTEASQHMLMNVECGLHFAAVGQVRSIRDLVPDLTVTIAPLKQV